MLKTVLRATAGLVVGAAAGFLSVVIVYALCDSPNTIEWEMSLLAIFLPAGTLVGAVTGAIVSARSQWLH